jgi:para-nitrobenzyl esterase
MTAKMNRRAMLQAAAMASAAGLLPRQLMASPLPTTTIATTKAGRVRGITTANGTLCFKGIQYGADTATTRFAAPKPPVPWSGVRDALEWGPRAPQVAGARPKQGEVVTEGYHLPPDEGVESEDCLHVNVWTPALGAVKKKRPVMVYIHGGAYSNGTVNAELYDGSRLARRGDIVVVTVNHRLNLFGYLYLAQLVPGQGFEDSGNAGQLDLVLALQWVRDNVAAFGGDPDCVTIFGQSGGGAKCATLMAQPPAHGLFHRVATMSGQQVTGAQPAHASERAKAVLKQLGLDKASPEDAARTLRLLPMTALQAATRAGGYYGPVTDGRSLPVDPFSPTDPKISVGVPMMLGNTHDETRVLLGSGNAALFSLTWETLPAALEKSAPYLHSDTVSLPIVEVIAKYREWHPAYTASDVFFAVTTDSRSWRGQVIEADRRAADAIAQPKTWVYQLNWKSPVDGGKFGAPHTLDIPLAFDNIALSPGMVGSSEADKARAQQMAEIVSETYLAFARTGNPNHAYALVWPAFDLEQRATMIFDLPSRIEDDPRGRERRYLGQVPYTQPGT